MTWIDRLKSWYRLQGARCTTCGQVREPPWYSELFCSPTCEDEYEERASRPM